MRQDDNLLSEINDLASDERAKVIDFIQRLKAKRDVQIVKSTASDLQIAPGSSSLMALQGLGKELWQALDVEQNLEEERNAWI